MLLNCPSLSRSTHILRRQILAPREIAFARPFTTTKIFSMSSVTQTITLPVCDASELKNGDIKDFEFGEGEKKGKVFLAKVDDKVVRAILKRFVL